MRSGPIASLAARPQADGARTASGGPPGAPHRRPRGRERVLRGSPALAHGAHRGRLRQLPRARAERSLRGRDRAVPHAPSGVAALRRGRPRRRGDRSRRPTGRPRAARAARGTGGGGHGGGPARGRGGGLLRAAQAPARRRGRGVTEHELLDAARAGDEDAFARLVEPHGGLLHAHCYRMLGSVDDAEDAVQDALLRAWRAIARFEGRSSLRTWLYTIATNVCLKAIERRPRLVLPVDYGPPTDPHERTAPPLVESVWIEPYPDQRPGLSEALAGPEARYEQRESVELAFIAALQLLPPRQRAGLVLRDVLGFSGQEVAEALETTPEAVYSALQRAHKTLDARLPERSQQATLR